MEIDYVYEDCMIRFVCPDCSSFVYADSQDGEEKCLCGLKYQLCSYLIINGEKVIDYNRITEEKE